ncbi:MAG: Co2+/Mg2+ efflux protein ApaG [Kofleriaceae bacterium]|nr:Co2+/Mg2+ efflux protein ApaG [Kofleriaceae bacterium]MCL4225152.1 Co2+/Mg2+ efflux protein ApaG [Myxococcales bacterium]
MPSAPIAQPTSSAVTQGVRVTVRAQYLPEQSAPGLERFVFAYTVTIANEGTAPVQLRTRHWIITDGAGKVEEVKGDGVVGEQPRLAPGQRFQYTSGCVLGTPVGAMHGTYQMYRDDGSWFDAEIAAFSLAMPQTTDRSMLN